jgi:hypothetical protein
MPSSTRRGALRVGSETAGIVSLQVTPPAVQTYHLGVGAGAVLRSRCAEGVAR